MQPGVSPFGSGSFGYSEDEQFRIHGYSAFASAQVEVGVILTGGTVMVEPNSILVGVAIGDVTTWATFNTFPVSIAVGAVIGSPSAGIQQLVLITSPASATATIGRLRCQIQAIPTGVSCGTVVGIGAFGPQILPTGINASAALGVITGSVSTTVTEIATGATVGAAASPQAVPSGLLAGVVVGAPGLWISSAPSGILVGAVVGGTSASIQAVPPAIAVGTVAGNPGLGISAMPGGILCWARVGPIFFAETVGGTTVVLNANTLAVSEYDIAGVVDVVEHGGEVYFVTGTGIKKLSSSGDENINSYIQTGQINFDSNSAKYITNLSVDTSPDSSMMVTGYISQPNGDMYMFPTQDSYRDGLNQQTRIFKTPRGIRGVYWGFKLENDGTNTFDINSITLDLLDTVLKR